MGQPRGRRRGEKTAGSFGCKSPAQSWAAESRMNDVSRGRLPRNFVRRSLCDCFSQCNQKLPLVGKLTAASERQARRRTLVSVESVHALLPSIRVHCLQGMARRNRIESHSGDHKVASSERTARVRYKPFAVNELSI